MSTNAMILHKNSSSRIDHSREENPDDNEEMFLHPAVEKPALKNFSLFINQTSVQNIVKVIKLSFGRIPCDFIK
jgi:hypothetical protein